MPAYINDCELSKDNSRRDNLSNTNFLGSYNYVQLEGNINKIKIDILRF